MKRPRQTNFARRTLRFESLSDRLLFAADLAIEPVPDEIVVSVEATSPLSDAVLEEIPVDPEGPIQNPDHRFDVDGDSHVSPIDALLLLNALDNQSTLAAVDSESVDAIFADVDGDGRLAAGDFEQIVSYLNGDIEPLPIQPEGEPTTDDSPLDVDGSGIIDERDAALIQDYLNTSDTESTPNSTNQLSDDRTRLDVNHDGRVTPVDLLQVVNFLNSDLDDLGDDEEILLDSLFADDSVSSLVVNT